MKSFRSPLRTSHAWPESMVAMRFLLFFCLCVPAAFAQEVFPVRDEGEARDRSV